MDTNLNKNHQLTLEFPIKWIEMDAYQHLNNARYFDYFTEFRFQWLLIHPELREWFSLNKLQGLIVKQDCEYFRGVTFPDTLIITQTIQSLGTSSIHLHYSVMSKSQQKECAQSHAILVCCDSQQKPTPIPESIKRAFQN